MARQSSFVERSGKFRQPTLELDLASSYPHPAFLLFLMKTQVLTPKRPSRCPNFSSGSPGVFHWVTQDFAWVTQATKLLRFGSTSRSLEFNIDPHRSGSFHRDFRYIFAMNHSWPFAESKPTGSLRFPAPQPVASHLTSPLLREVKVGFRQAEKGLGTKRD